MLTRYVRLTLALLLAVTAFAVTGAARAQGEKVLVVGHAESTDSLDPARGYTQSTSIIHRATYQSLVTFPADSASEIKPELAESWTISADGTDYVFTLKADAVFSNGDPVTAEDVAFSFTRLLNIKGNPASLADTIKSVEAWEGKVVLTLNAPDPAILSKLVFGGFSVLNSKLVKANGGTDAADAATTDKAEIWLNQNSAGTGPYILVKWDPQVQTVLERNPNYKGTAPYYDRIVVTNIAESATQKSALESGEIQVATDLTADQVKGLAGNSKVGIYQGSGNIVHFLLMNNNPEIGGPLSNPKVQKAVRLALDYEGYLKLYGGVTPASVIPVGFLGAYGSDKALKTDVDAAKKLLEEAGFKDGFEVTLSYPVFTFQGVNLETNAQKVQADLAKIGITVKLNPGELQVSLEEYRTGKQAFGYWFWGPDFIDPQNYLEFLPGKKVGGTRANWDPAKADKAIVDLLDAALKETDAAKRVENFAKIQDYMQESGPFAPFLQPGVQAAFSANITGYIWHPQWTLDLSLIAVK